MGLHRRDLATEERTVTIPELVGAIVVAALDIKEARLHDFDRNLKLKKAVRASLANIRKCCNEIEAQL
jgi:hypothetical protein